jgi:hypothetical protein
MGLLYLQPIVAGDVDVNSSAGAIWMKNDA